MGAWNALWELKEKDKNGNVVRGDVLLQNAKNNLVFAEERLVACIGIEDLIVVETQDSVVVATKNQIQEVKQLGQSYTLRVARKLPYTEKYTVRGGGMIP